MSVVNEEDWAQPAAVRVECEAIDCGALLEVEVPNQHSSTTPLIVRCGSCNRLLEVWLHVPSSDERPSVAMPQSYQSAKVAESHIKPPTRRVTAVKRRHTAPEDGSYGKQGFKPLLVKPPPLSRFTVDSVRKDQHGQFCGKSNSMMEMALGQFGQPESTFSPHIWRDGQGGNFEGSFLGMQNIGLSHDLEEKDDGTRGRAKKSKKTRNPSPYNLYMSEEVKRIKAEHPTVDHKQAFKMAARHWAKSPHDCRKNSSLSSSNFKKAPQSSEPVVGPPASSPVPHVDISKNDPAGNATKVMLGQASIIPAEGLTPSQSLPEFETQVIISDAPEPVSSTRRGPGTEFEIRAEKESYDMQQPERILVLDESSSPKLGFENDFPSSHVKNASLSSPEMLTSSLALDTTSFLDAENDTTLSTS